MFDFLKLLCCSKIRDRSIHNVNHKFVLVPQIMGSIYTQEYTLKKLCSETERNYKETSANNQKEKANIKIEDRSLAEYNTHTTDRR